MNDVIRSVVVGVCLLGLAAFAGEKSASGLPMPKDEKAFLERLHHNNQMEIQIGQLAQQKATNPQVKSFAQTLVNDHRTADQQVMSAAQKKKLTLAEPKPASDTEKKLMDSHKAEMAKLQALEGPAFDSAFMSAMVGDHDMAILKAQAAAQQFQGSDVGTMAQQMVPKLTQHREQAYQILGQVSASNAGVGGAGSQQGGSMQHGGSMQGGSMQDPATRGGQRN